MLFTPLTCHQTLSFIKDGIMGYGWKARLICIVTAGFLWQMPGTAEARKSVRYAIVQLDEDRVKVVAGRSDNGAVNAALSHCARKARGPCPVAGLGGGNDEVVPEDAGDDGPETYAMLWKKAGRSGVLQGAKARLIIECLQERERNRDVIRITRPVRAWNSEGQANIPDGRGIAIVGRTQVEEINHAMDESRLLCANPSCTIDRIELGDTVRTFD